MAGMLLTWPFATAALVPPTHCEEFVTNDLLYVPLVQVEIFPEVTSGPMGGHGLPLGHQDGAAEE